MAERPERHSGRRLLLALLVAVTAAVTASAFNSILLRDGAGPLDAALVALYVVLMVWLALGTWLSFMGFGVLVARRLRRGPVPPEPRPLAGRTAIVMPVYNEPTEPVFARLRAILATIDAAGESDAFDIFILSDTRDPEIWLAEEASWALLRRDDSPRERVFYRRRLHNVARKSGNVADFLERWGRRYPYFVVLDADSIMDGATIVEMARRMEANPRLALLQVPPLPVRGETLAARAQEFAASLFGPLAATGLGWLAGAQGNFWGHNAIIRTEAFIGSARLPKLPGSAPLGGEILSHDFVEAALLLRAGWEVRMADDLAGSYEESPPTIVDFAKRDRRWCQGNLQHFRLIFARTLDPMSRLYFGMGVMAYVSSLIWLLFLALGAAELARRLLAPPVYFAGASREPVWPVSVESQAMALLLVTLGLLFLPKLLGWLLALVSRERRRGFGGLFGLTLSFVAETLYTALLAPIMMLFHSQFVLAILTGRAVGWGPQRRGVTASALGEAVQVHGWHTAVGIAAGAALWVFAPGVFWWALPIVLGLVLSIPLALVAGDPAIGQRIRGLGLFVTPEERKPPRVVRMVSEQLAALPPPDPRQQSRFSLAMVDPALNALHVGLVRGLGEVSERDPEELEAIARKADEEGVETLTRAERIAVLEDPDLAERIHQALWRRWLDRAQAVAR